MFPRKHQCTYKNILFCFDNPKYAKGYFRNELM